MIESEFLSFAIRQERRLSRISITDSVLLMLSNFRRRLSIGDNVREVTVEAGQAVWSPAQVHTGENIGSTDTHLVFVELKG